MSKSWNRIETWLALAVLAVGGVVAAIFGLHVYVTATATPLHPDSQRIPSEVRTAQAPGWLDAITQGRQAVRAGMTEQNLPGVSVAVGIGGGLVWAEGFGWSNLETHAPVTPDTPFRIGTASTVLTSAAVGLLLEQGRLRLDDEIQTFVPGYATKQWPVTLRQLLGHTAGIGNDGGDEGPLYGEHCERPVEALAQFGDDALRFEPGTRYRYSSYGWILVSAAVESAGNEPFLRFMREWVFQPLGMGDTRADASPGESSGRATPYFPRYAADPRYGPDPMRDVDYSCYAGASVFVSTPSDLVRFGMAMERGTFLKPETVQLLQATQRLRSGEETGYGLGWDLETVTLAGRTTRVVGHDGDSLGGMLASLTIVPDRGLVVAVTSNTSYADTAGIALKLAEAFAGRGDPASK